MQYLHIPHLDGSDSRSDDEHEIINFASRLQDHVKPAFITDGCDMLADGIIKHPCHGEQHQGICLSRQSLVGPSVSLFIRTCHELLQFSRRLPLPFGFLDIP